MALRLTKNEDETWTQAALRAARRYGMEEDVQAAIEDNKAAGQTEEDAAFNACWDWDVLEYVAEPTNAES